MYHAMIIFGSTDKGFLSIKQEGMLEYDDDHCSLFFASNTFKDINEIARIVHEHKSIDDIVTKTIELVDDLFLALIFLKNEKSIVVFSDISSSFLSFYYCTVDDGIIFSTSLKKLLSTCNINREFDFESIAEFFDNGIVYGKKTLMKGVYKLPLGKYLYFNSGEIHEKDLPVLNYSRSKKIDKNDFFKTFRSVVFDDSEKAKRIVVPLSGGFDSNLIMNSVKKMFDGRKTVIAFSIGGKNGSNETDVAEFISNYYGVDFRRIVITEDSYQFLPDIVWRLEGLCFESGVFLQYFLAKAISSINDDDIVVLCGESSDEIQSKYYLSNLDSVRKNNIKGGEKLYMYSDPFIYTNQLILKKSSIFMNSFGIKSVYPFKNKRVYSNLLDFSFKNGTEKKYYKKACKKVLPREIGNLLQTKGGTTGTIDFSNLLNENYLFDSIPSFKRTHVSLRRKCLRLVQSIKQIIELLSRNGMSHTRKYIKNHRIQNRINERLKLLYLQCFNELFISKKYDVFFCRESLDIKLKDLFDEKTKN